MNVYLSIITYEEGMPQDLDDVIGFNRYFYKELRSRGYSLVNDPFNADIIFMLPGWRNDQYCLTEYEAFKQDKLIVTSLESLEGALRESCE